MERISDGKETRKLTYEKLTVTVIFILGIVFLLWRAPYGYCFNDEPFIVSLGRRIFSGDKMFFDEWHGAQAFGIVLHPIYGIFRLLTGGTEGILLTFRYLYCVLYFFTCICVYCTARKYTGMGEAVFVYLILFSPLDYMTCSYTSFGLMTCLQICRFMLAIISGGSMLRPAAVGVAFAGLFCVLILCSPFFSALFIMGMIVLLVWSLLPGQKGEERSAALKFWWACVITAAVIALLCFVFFVLGGGKLCDIPDNIAMILRDPEHQTGLLERVKSIYLYLRPRTFFYLPCAVISALCMIIKDIRFKRAVFFALAVIFAATRFNTTVEAVDHSIFNLEMLDIAVLGFYSFLMLKNKPWKLFLCFNGMGTFYTLLNLAVSNTGIMALSFTMTVCGTSGIIYTFMLMRELAEFKTKKLGKICAVATVVVILAAQFSTQLYVRFTSQYWDDHLPNLTEKIEVGASKGLITCSEQKEKYEEKNRCMEVLLADIQHDEDAMFLNISDDPVIYLDADLPVASFSGWTFGYGDNLPDVLNEYYTFNPRRLPLYIFGNTENEKRLIELLSKPCFRGAEYELKREGSMFLAEITYDNGRKQ